MDLLLKALTHMALYLIISNHNSCQNTCSCRSSCLFLPHHQRRGSAEYASPVQRSRSPGLTATFAATLRRWHAFVACPQSFHSGGIQHCGMLPTLMHESSCLRLAAYRWGPVSVAQPGALELHVDTASNYANGGMASVDIALYLTLEI